MKNSNDAIGNRNRVLLARRAGPQTQKTEPVDDRVLTELEVLTNNGKDSRVHAPEMLRSAEHFCIYLTCFTIWN
jgi:hypothetical protein